MSVTFRKGKAEDWKIVYDLICDMEGTELPAEAFHGIYRMRRKTPPFRAGDIRRVRRICVSN
jgi:hypothetical protein